VRTDNRSLIRGLTATAIIAFTLGFFFPRSGALTTSLPDGSQDRDSTGTISEPVQINNLDEIWRYLGENYYDPSKLDKATLEHGAVKGFVKAIDDPYTVYMTPDESKNFTVNLDGELEGIGAELEMKDSRIIVVTPLKKSPAEKAGLKPKDIISEIDGTSTENVTLEDAVKKIRGKKGTTIVLTVEREGESEPLEISIKRDSIVLESVVVEKLEEGKIFHLNIYQFNTNTEHEFNEAIQEILLEKPEGLIIDVRGNGGGYLDTAVHMLTEFFKKGTTVAIIKKRAPEDNEVLKTTATGRITDIPLVVLIDKGSASASEILAGALQDHKRALIVGSTSFGKGSVQELIKIADGSLLRYTIARWFTPNDRSIDEVGITPDIEVEVTEEDIKAQHDVQLEAAVTELKKRF